MSKLDVTYCSKFYRKKFLSIICDDQYIKYGNIQFDSRCKYIDNVMLWFGSRKVSIPSKLSINWSDSITIDGITGISTSNCNNLTTLNLRGCKNINDDCIILITSNSPNLKNLDISYCSGVTNRGIEEMARNLNLQLLSLSIEVFDTGGLGSSDNERTDEAIIELAKYCHNIESLDISSNWNITDRGISELVHNCSKIKKFNIGGCSRITSTAVVEIAHHLTDLQCFKIVGCKLIDNQGMIAIAECCQHLKALELGDCDQIDESLISIAKKCKRLEILSIGPMRTITTDIMMEVATNLTSLQSLMMSLKYRNYDESMIQLVRNNNLHSLYISECQLTDLFMFEIAKSISKSLTNLDIMDCDKFTSAGLIEALSECCCLQRLYLGGTDCDLSDDCIDTITTKCLNLEYIYIRISESSLVSNDSIIRLVNNSISLKSITINYDYSRGSNAKTFAISSLRLLDINAILKDIRK